MNRCYAPAKRKLTKMAVRRSAIDLLSTARRRRQAGRGPAVKNQVRAVRRHRSNLECGQLAPALGLGGLPPVARSSLTLRLAPLRCNSLGSKLPFPKAVASNRTPSPEAIWPWLRNFQNHGRCHEKNRLGKTRLTFSFSLRGPLSPSFRGPNRGRRRPSATLSPHPALGRAGCHCS